MFKCRSCEVLKAENQHLREWINRLMEERHPPILQPIEPEPEPKEDESIIEQFGE